MTAQFRFNLSYDDMQGAAQAAANVAALTNEAYRDTPFIMPFFRHDQDDYIYHTFQFSHRKRLGSALASIHIHCIPMVNPVVPQDVYFYYAYTWQTVGGTFPASASWTSGNSAMTVGGAEAFTHKYHSLVSNIAAPVGEGYSSILLLTLARLGTDPNDTYTTSKAVPPGTAAANLAFLYCDIHYLLDRSGSLLEGSDG